MDVEDAAVTRHDLDRRDGPLPLLQDSRRQTGGVRECSSGDAVLDAHVVTLGHLRILPDGNAVRGTGHQAPPSARLGLRRARVGHL